MPLFTYVAHIDGRSKVGEVMADDEQSARVAALKEARRESANATITRVFHAPVRLSEAPRPGAERVRLSKWDRDYYGHRRRA